MYHLKLNHKFIAGNLSRPRLNERRKFVVKNTHNVAMTFRHISFKATKGQTVLVGVDCTDHKTNVSFRNSTYRMSPNVEDYVSDLTLPSEINFRNLSKLTRLGDCWKHPIQRNNLIRTCMKMVILPFHSSCYRSRRYFSSSSWVLGSLKLISGYYEVGFGFR
jgi:hypothetical protein